MAYPSCVADDIDLREATDATVVIFKQMQYTIVTS